MEWIAEFPVFWVALLGLLCVLYVLPTLIAIARSVRDLGLVVAVNFIGGATGIGWGAALVLSLCLDGNGAARSPGAHSVASGSALSRDDAYRRAIRQTSDLGALHDKRCG